MENKEFWIIILGVLGWSWGVFQFILKRKYQKKDKLTDKRFDAYTSYMKKADELLNNVRNDPNMIYGISSELQEVILNGDEEEINKALVDFNTKLLDFVKKASDPLMILRQELNTLQIICSKKLQKRIDEFNVLATDFNNHMQKSLSIINPNDANQMIQELQTLSQNERWKRFESLNNEIISLMRKELGSD